MYYVIGAVLTSFFLYWVLQSRDDDQARQQGREPASAAKRVMLLFFLLVVTTFLFFLITNSIPRTSVATSTAAANAEGGAVLAKNYKMDMVKNIREDVIVGLPPFGAFGGAAQDDVTYD